jgi:PAS domain S-box-containing protein
MCKGEEQGVKQDSRRRTRRRDAAALRHRLAEAQRTIRALTSAQIDAVLLPEGASAVVLREAQEELRRLNVRLERSEAYFRSVIENISDIVSILDGHGIVKYINPSVRRVLGYEPGELIGRSAFEHVHPEDAPRVTALFREAVQKGDGAGLATFRYRHKNGSWLHLESTALTLLADPAVEGIVVTSRDVTLRLQMETRYRPLFEHMVEGFAHCRMLLEEGRPPDFVYLEVNRAFEKLTGCKNVQGRRVTEVIPNFLETNRDVVDALERVARTGSTYRSEVFVPYLGRWFRLSAYRSELGCFVILVDNITEHKRMQEALQRSEAAYRGLVEHAPLGIYKATPDGRLLMANTTLASMLGYASRNELLAHGSLDEAFAHPADRGRLAAVLERGDKALLETEWRKVDGSRISVRIHAWRVGTGNGGVHHVEATVEDVTEQRSLQRQFLQAQKMEAIGRLAGGVAHDFNNLLTAIIGYSDMLLDDLPASDQKRADVAEIRAAADRATSLTRQLLAFSRKQVFETRALDLNYIVRAIEKMLRRLIGEDITLNIVLSPSPARVNADPNQIEQVILNLVVNARDAMPQGGTLTIETALVEIDRTYSSTHLAMEPGPYVLLAVSDTGHGMDAETLSHIFEPFFTTKEKGKGTGLGLSTVYGIMKQSGGYIWAYSEPGRGSTFKAYLPCLRDAPEEWGSPVDTSAPISRGGAETILVAEDDAKVREIVARVLAAKGYTLLVAAGGAEALEMARAHDGPIDLLLTDLVMPGMTGRELAAALKAERAEMRTLYMSGYTDDAVFRHGVLEAGMNYLQKPFCAESLARKVRHVLDGPA